jgi:hypothetical protein
MTSARPWCRCFRAERGFTAAMPSGTDGHAPSQSLTRGSSCPDQSHPEHRALTPRPDQGRSGEHHRTSRRQHRAERRGRQADFPPVIRGRQGWRLLVGQFRYPVLRRSREFHEGAGHRRRERRIADGWEDCGGCWLGSVGRKDCGCQRCLRLAEEDVFGALVPGFGVLRRAPDSGKSDSAVLGQAADHVEDDANLA